MIRGWIRACTVAALVALAAWPVYAQQWETGTDGLRPIPPLTARVTDLTQTLSAAEKQALEAKLAGTVKNKSLPLLIVCASGARAQRAVAVAKKLGYEQAQALAGGLKSWKDANLPLEKA